MRTDESLKDRTKELAKQVLGQGKINILKKVIGR